MNIIIDFLLSSIVNFIGYFVNLAWDRKLSTTSFNLLDIKKFHEQGAHAQGRVIFVSDNDFVTGKNFTYEFTDANSVRHMQKMQLDRSRIGSPWAVGLELLTFNPDLVPALAVGDSLDIIYDPANPQKNYPEIGLKDIYDRPLLDKSNVRDALHMEFGWPALILLLFIGFLVAVYFGAKMIHLNIVPHHG